MGGRKVRDGPVTRHRIKNSAGVKCLGDKGCDTSQDKKFHRG